LSIKKEQIVALQQELAGFENTVISLESQIETLNSKLLTVSNEKAKVSNEELTAYMTSYTKLTEDKTKIDADISNLNNEIKKLLAIVDTCPTCGQHLPNVHKPDVSVQKAALQEALVKRDEVNAHIAKCESQHKEYVAQIDSAFNDEISALNENLTIVKVNLATARNDKGTCAAVLDTEKTAYDKISYDKQNCDNFILKQKNEIARLEAEIAKTTNLISITSLAKDEIDQRLNIIKKMDTLIKRDFRGYLLINIIDFIDAKAKEYCNIVFGTKELSLTLNGNALDITYCNKVFDGLSGGEKQRVDLILQLAIRDLLTSYLDLNANILVLDEVTDFLDKKSCQAVMQLLEKELNTVESVFIISHHVEELGLPVDSEIKIIKNELGISELY
jgi:DNA repair exonuclease SbcCD ATPase subunit